MNNPSIIVRAAAASALALAVAANFSALGQTNEAAVKPAAKADLLFPDPVVAKGRGFEIKRSELDDEAIRFKADIARLGRAVPPEQEATADRQVIEGLIQSKLLLAKATDAEKAKAKEAAEKRISAERAKATSEESFRRQLKAAGLTLDLFETRLTEAAIVEAVLTRELNVSVSDEAVKRFYDEHPAQFEQPETVRVAHIMFSTSDAIGQELPDEQKQAKRKKAEDILKQVRAGEDFGTLAREYSEDAGSRDRGGALRPIQRGLMLPELSEFEAAAFSLVTNQVSDIVTTKAGYHIIKVLYKTPAKMIEFEKVADDIRQALKTREIRKLAPAYLEKLKKDAGVEILDEKLKAVTLPAPADKDAAE